MKSDQTASDFSGEGNFDYRGGDLEHMDSAINYHKHILNIFSKYIKHKVVEVGAGRGSFCHLILNRFPEVEITALEPSKSMYKLLDKIAKDNQRLKARNQFLQDITNELKQDQPDSFIYVNVLEHVENDLDILKNTYDILKPGGYILTFTPALHILMSKFDRLIGHYRRYSKKEMEDKMRQAGFEIVESYYFDIIGSLMWWIKFKLLKSVSIGSGSASIFDKFFVPIIKLEPKWLPFGKNIVVIGYKK